jgi:ribosomal protein S13
MNLIILGRTLPQNDKIVFALTKLYGIGLSSSISICRDLGMLPNLKVKDLTDRQQLLLAKKIKNEFMNPQNMGEVKDANGIGKIGNPTCGDIMHVSIKVEKDKKGNEILKDIKF